MGATTVIDTSGACRIKRIVFTFDRDYEFGEFVDIADIPSGARIFRMFIGAVPDFFTSAYASVGTERDPLAISQTDPAYDVTWDAINGFQPVNNLIWFRDELAQKLRLTFKDSNNGQPRVEGLAGKSIVIQMEYTFTE
jgi:hypothetical protein